MIYALGFVLVAGALWVAFALASWLASPHGGEITGPDLYRAAKRRNWRQRHE